MTLFTCPRRFGKSLNMSMMEAFFSPDSDKSIFDGLKISGERELCDSYMGKYPIVSVSLKGTNAESFETARNLAVRIVREAARKYESILPESRALSENDMKDYAELLDVDMPEEVLYKSLQTLSALLEKHYGQKTIILIDEYDVPLAKATEQGYYDQMVIPDGVTEVSSEAFYNCESLETAYVPGSVTIIKKNAFGACDNLTDIYYGGSEDSWKSLYTWDLERVKGALQLFILRAGMEPQAALWPT